MHIPGPRPLALSLLALLLACGVLAAPAGGADPDGPTITSPRATDALYDGYTGPFVVQFGGTPDTTYVYSVIADPAGAATVVRGPIDYFWNGSSGDHQIKVAALPPGSYRFAISDKETHTHSDQVDFTVRSGSAPKCSLVVPSRVRVGAPLVRVTGKLSSTCGTLGVRTADWKVNRGGRTFDYYHFDGNSSDTWSLYDSDPIGAYSIVPLSAHTQYDPVPQNSPTVVARRDSRLTLSGTRSGSFVTLRTSLKVYSPSTNLFRPWTGKYVAVSYRSCSTCSWHHLRTLTTDGRGWAASRFWASKVREYRVAVSGNTGVWEPFSRYAKV